MEATCYTIITSYLFINYVQYFFNTGNSLGATMSTVTKSIISQQNNN